MALSDDLPDKPEQETWITLKMWEEIVRLSDVKQFEEFYKKFSDKECLKLFKDIYDSPQP